jgi:hypothetical protein
MASISTEADVRDDRKFREGFFKKPNGGLDGRLVVPCTTAAIVFRMVMLAKEEDGTDALLDDGLHGREELVDTITELTRHRSNGLLDANARDNKGWPAPLGRRGNLEVKHGAETCGAACATEAKIGKLIEAHGISSERGRLLLGWGKEVGYGCKV